MYDPMMGRRKTIYDLDSYASSGPSVSDILKLSTTEITAEPPRKIRYSVSIVSIFFTRDSSLYHFQNFSPYLYDQIVAVFVHIKSNEKYIKNISN